MKFLKEHRILDNEKTSLTNGVLCEEMGKLNLFLVTAYVRCAFVTVFLFLAKIPVTFSSIMSSYRGILSLSIIESSGDLEYPY